MAERWRSEVVLVVRKSGGGPAARAPGPGWKDVALKVLTTTIAAGLALAAQCPDMAALLR
jgi:hypothetical protein